MSAHTNTNDLYPHMFYRPFTFERQRAQTSLLNAIAGDGEIAVMTNGSHWIEMTNTMLTAPFYTVLPQTVKNA
jgi:hypothetical protein